MKRLFLLALLSVASTALETPANVTISLFATDLHGCDLLEACDPYVRILCVSVSSDWKECGRTSVLHNDNYPLWPQTFVFPIVQADQLRWRFDIMDKDAIGEDVIGTVTTSLAEFLTATSIQPTHRHNIPNEKGVFYIHKRS